MRIFIIWAILLIVLASPTVGQRRGGEPHDFSQPVYFETHNLPATDSLQSRIDIVYRIPYNFFIFIKNTSAERIKPFVGNSEIAIEILDKSKTSVARTLTQRFLQADISDPDSLKSDFIQGGTSTLLPPDVYTVVVEVNDRESRNHFLDNSRVIMLKDFLKEKLDLCDVIFSHPPRQHADSAIVPLNYNETIPFGEKVQILAQLKLPMQPESLQTTLHIYRRNHRTPERTMVFSDSNAGSFSIRPGQLMPVFNDSDFYYRLNSSPVGHYYLLSTILPSDSFAQGEYELEFLLNCGGMVNKSSHRFMIRWFDMPRSLRNPELAVSVLKYIMPENDFQKIRHANNEERDSLFERFWKQRDPTPGTAINEVMAEYYNRADYALTHFGTLQHSNGTETDRGRMYMLLGPPTTVQREMQPPAPPRETWDYATLHKHLVFIDESRQGNYKLITPDD